MDLVLRDLDVLLTMDDARDAGPLGRIADAAVAFAEGRVAWIGPSGDAPDATDVRSLPGCIALPGLVDAHTHAVWAGSRTDEWEARLQGAAYQDALAEGGGIHRAVASAVSSSSEAFRTAVTVR
ncbi:MAG: imidazolonepropionase, partial [Myxococcota bacterium]